VSISASRVRRRRRVSAGPASPTSRRLQLDEGAVRGVDGCSAACGELHQLGPAVLRVGCPLEVAQALQVVVDADKLAYAVHLRDAGHSIGEIVAKTGIARTSLYRRLPPRPAAQLTEAPNTEQR